MGTNFYRVKQITENDKIKLHKLIDSNNIIGFENESVESYIRDLTEEIHICKRSGGWQICFNHNKGKYYQPNRKSLEEFLSQPNTEIKDEYGKVYSFEEFWNMVDEWNANPKNDWTSKKYNQWEREQGHNYYNNICHTDASFCRNKFNVIPEDNDFSVDGLRFAVFTDFS